MFKALTPIAALLIAAGLVFTYVHPSFIAIQAIERETVEYENALRHASALQERIDEKLARRRAFDQVGLVRLSQLLPTEVNEIETIMTLDDMARTHGMSISDIEITEPSTAQIGVRPDDGAGAVAVENPDPALDPSMDPGIGGGEETDRTTHIDFGFTANGTYDQLKDFVEDLERSLTLFEVMSLSFDESEDDEGPTAFDFTVRTYAHTTTE